MSEHENEVRTRLTIAAEAATRGLEGVRGIAERLEGTFERLKEIGMGLFGVGGAFAFAEAAKGAADLYQTVSRLSAVTGASVSSIDSMVDVLGRAGIEGEEAESVVIRMTKGLQNAAGAAALTGQRSADLRKQFRALGVDIKKGPQDMLVQMAASAKAGHLQVADLMGVFGVQKRSAADMMTLLKQGPEVVREMEDDRAKSGARITADSLKQYELMVKSKREAKDALQDTFSIVYRTFLPTLTKFFEAVSTQLTKWQPQIQRGMDYLTSHMSQVVKMVERIAMLSAGNKLLNLATGKGIGGAIGVVGGVLGKMIAPAAGSAPGGLVALGPLQGIVSALLRLRPLVAGIGKLGAIGAVIMVAVEGVRLIVSNWNGIRDSMMATFRSIVGHVKAIWGYLGPPLMKIASQVAKAVLWAADKFGWLVDKVFAVVEKIAWLVGKILDVFSTIVGSLEGAASWVARKLGFGGDNGEVEQTDSEFYATHSARQARVFNQLYRQGEVAKIVAGQKGILDAQALAKQLSTSNVNIQQDFRGSKFEVKQEFAEGFDAGKVVVAMADRMASLGERRLQSGFSPLYGTRG